MSTETPAQALTRRARAWATDLLRVSGYTDAQIAALSTAERVETASRLFLRDVEDGPSLFPTDR